MGGVRNVATLVKKRMMPAVRTGGTEETRDGPGSTCVHHEHAIRLSNDHTCPKALPVALRAANRSQIDACAGGLTHFLAIVRHTHVPT